MNALRHFCSIVLALSVSFAHGNERQAIGSLGLSRITTKEGLAHNNVLDILQDRRGFLWIGTDGGLCRYDGRQFKVFRHDPSREDSLSGSGASRLLEDRAGNLWVGTWGFGLNYFEVKTETVTRYPHQPETEGGLKGMRVQALYLDHADGVWIGTYNHGLNRFDPETGRFSHYPYVADDAKALPNPRVWAITETAAGHIWIGTSGGLSLLDRTTGVFSHIKEDMGSNTNLSNNIVQTLLTSKTGTLWVGTKKGLSYLDPGTRILKRFIPQNGAPDFVDITDIRLLLEDHEGRLWAGKGDGDFYLIDPKTAATSLISLGVHESDSPLDFRAIFEDASRILWLGSFNGLHKTDLKPAKFRHHFKNPKRPNGLSGNRISAIHEDSASVLWLATFEGKLNRYNRALDQYTVYDVTEKEIRAILEDDLNQLWLGTFSQGLFAFDRENGRIRAFAHDPDQPDSIGHNQVRSLSQTGDGRLWVGTHKGLNRFDPLTEKFENPTNHPFLREHVGERRVESILPRTEGSVWVGTDDGLIHLDPERGASMRFAHEKDNVASLSNNLVNCLHLDGKDRLWCGTNAGLNLLLRDGSFRRYLDTDGLPNNVINGILEDSAGRLWISTEHGLSRFDPELTEFRNYDVYDGLQDTGFNRAAFHSPSGEMFFGGDNGFNSFFPQKVLDNDHPPNLMLTRFTVSKQGADEARPIIGADEITLAYHENMFSVVFAALDFTLPEKNRYTWRLVNFNEAWVEETTTPQVSYTNLDPGRYILEIRGANSDSVWSEKTLAIGITIIPPIWKTWWAYAIYALIAIALAFGLPLLRIRRLKQREEKLAWLIGERTKEIRAKNTQLGEKNKELLAFDEIIQSINREVEMKPLLPVLLEQGVKLFQKADTGAYLNFDHQTQRFRFEAAVGVNHEQLAPISLNWNEAVGRYSMGHEELEEGIYLIKPNPQSNGEPGLGAAEESKSMVTMTVVIDGLIEGFFIFEHRRDEGAFRVIDIDKLKRYRQHAISAVAKARIFKELADTAQHLKETQEKLMEAAHHAGMAEVASNVLHNVGNTLNSINTSSELIWELTRTPALDLLNKVVTLIDAGEDSLPQFFIREEKDRRIALALAQIATTFDATHQDLRKEAIELKKQIAALKLELTEQEEYIHIDEVQGDTNLNECMDAALTSEQNQISARSVSVIKEYQSLPSVRLPKSKFQRVLMNLVANAVNAMDSVEGQPTLVLRSSASREGHLRIEIEDNGRGIEPENQKRIFNQGFTGRNGGSFGLHYCANVLKEMGGKISVYSKGPGKGATFILDLPGRAP